MTKTTTHKPKSSARERVLHTAEKLFHDHGYNAVSMRDLANALDMKQASLYYHVPDGKEQLFVEVTQRGLHRHQAGIGQAIAGAGPNLEAQLTAVSHWFIEQPALNLMPMFENDMPALSEASADRLNQLAYQALFSPLTDAFGAAIERGEIQHHSADHLAGMFLMMIDGVMYAWRTQRTGMALADLATDMIDMMLNGLRPRHQGESQ